MKRNILLIAGLLACISSPLFAQFEGKRFLTGDAILAFQSSKPEIADASHNYSAGANLQLGKFRTNNMASGLVLGFNLSGIKLRYRDVDGPVRSQSGINGVGGNVGYFWQYYKHINDKFGVFAGPQALLRYGFTKNLESRSSSNNLLEVREHEASLGLSLGAGAYYALSERWWLQVSLAFAAPFSVTYTHNESSQVGRNKPINTTDRVETSFAPAFNFPAVGIGLRYFLK